CLGHSSTFLSDILRELGQLKEAEQACRAALAIRQKLAEDFPAVPEHRANYATSLATLGLVLHQSGQLQETELTYRQAMVVLEELIAQFPNVDGYAVKLGGSYGKFGTLMYETGRTEVSLEWYAKAIRTLRAVLGRDQRLVAARAFLQNSYHGRAEALTQLKRYADALLDWDHALGLAEGPTRTPLRVQRAYTLVRAGHHAEGVAEVDDLTQARHLHHEHKTLFDSACVCALASAVGEEEPELAQAYAARAITLLRRLQRAGGFAEAAEVAALKKDTALDPLRSLRDFNNLVRDVERIAGPEAK